MLNWVNIYRLKEKISYSEIKNRISLGFLFDLILAVRYEPLKMSQKKQKYFNNYNKKEQAINCLSKVIYFFKFVIILELLKNLVCFPPQN